MGGDNRVVSPSQERLSRGVTLQTGLANEVAVIVPIETRRQWALGGGEAGAVWFRASTPRACTSYRITHLVLDDMSV